MTDFEARVLNAIDAFWSVNYRPPTIREIAAVLETPGHSTVARAVERLESKGHLIGGRKNSNRRVVPVWVRNAIEGARK